MTYRDFQAAKSVPEKYNPDFQASSYNGHGHAQVNGLLKPVLNKKHKPELSDKHTQMNSKDWFAAWYDECAGPAGKGLTCGATAESCKQPQSNGIPCGYSYRFDDFLPIKYNAVTKKYSYKSAPGLFPINDQDLSLIHI